MSRNKVTSKELENIIQEAILSLRQMEYDNAYDFIMKAININPNIPEPHNLLGIWYEARGNNDLARKHYRIAYVLDSRFKPAGTNLQRVGTVFQYENIPIDYGEEDE
jgi:Flp pilus assembly protein TadD